MDVNLSLCFALFLLNQKTKQKEQPFYNNNNGILDDDDNGQMVFLVRFIIIILLMVTGSIFGFLFCPIFNECNVVSFIHSILSYYSAPGCFSFFVLLFCWTKIDSIESIRIFFFGFLANSTFVFSFLFCWLLVVVA